MFRNSIVPSKFNSLRTVQVGLCEYLLGTITLRPKHFIKFRVIYHEI